MATPAKAEADSSAKSPVASANMKDMGAAPSVSNSTAEAGGKAPAAKDMGVSQEAKLSPAKADATDGSDSSAKSAIAG